MNCEYGFAISTIHSYFLKRSFKMKILTSLIGSALMFVAVSANAALLVPTSINATGAVNNPANFSDGVFPNEGGQWQTNTSWWIGASPVLTLTYAEAFNIEDILLSVDNNDNYSIQYSMDNSSWSSLFDISRSYGEVGWGMDTMSTLSGHGEYISAIDFSPVQAQFLRIFATGGDNLYSVGEFQAFGSNVSAVPLPAAAFMFIPALLGFLGFRRKVSA